MTKLNEHFASQVMDNNDAIITAIAAQMAFPSLFQQLSGVIISIQSTCQKFLHHKVALKTHCRSPNDRNLLSWQSQGQFSDIFSLF